MRLLTLVLAVTLLLVLPGFQAVTVAQFGPPPLPSVCAPNLNDKLICVLPQLYGPNGLTLPNPRFEGHFTTSSNQQLQGASSPITAAIGTQLTSLPVASPASGVLFTFDRTLGVVTRSTESYGPILNERAETIGRHRLYVAGTYQYFKFSSLDGIALEKVPQVFGSVEFPVFGVIPPFEHDYITADNRIDLKIHQVTFYGSFGITDRIDISAAVPILDVRLGVTGTAHIVRLVPQPVSPTDPFFPASSSGFFEFFDFANPAGSLDATFQNQRSASGIGDVVFRVKGTLLRRERLRVASGLDVRTPTGDEENFLGSGAPGVKPFVAASYRARVSPHVNIGFEWNGKSLLAGNLMTGTTGKLPNQFFYSVGADVGVTKRWTVDADLLGQRVSSFARVRKTTYVSQFGETFPGVSTTVPYFGPANIVDVAIGTKVNPVGNLLVTGNVLFKANDAGLRATVVPLVGLSYSF